MHIRAITLLTLLLLVVQGWSKPSKDLEDDYSEDAQADDEEYSQGDEDGDTPDAIEIPPQIKSNPMKIRARVGDNVTLPCETTNAESFATVWKKDKEFLYSDDNALTQDQQRIVRTPDNSLHIYNVTVNDSSNTYNCSIMASKVPITITHKLLVVPNDGSFVPMTTMPPMTTPPSSSGRQIYVTPSDRVVATQGANVTLGCHPSVQPPPKEIKWYRENLKLSNNRHMRMQGDYLTIYKVGRHDGGLYQCLADNGMDNPPHSAIHLTVHYAPEIEVKRDVVHTGAGVESELTCYIHAVPSANVIWYKNEEEELPKKGRISRKDVKLMSTLRITHTSEQDLGNYTCFARNKLGQASKTVLLTGTPSQAVISGVETTKDDNGLILKWHLESYSPITQYQLKYRRKGDQDWEVTEPRVTDGKGNQYTVEHAIEGLPAGSYETVLEARNSFGWSPSDTHTFVRDSSLEEAAGVKGSSAVSIRPFWALSVSLLVVCAFRNL